MVALTNFSAEPVTAETPVVPQVRVLFMGTPALSAELLSFLLAQKFNVVGVVTKKDMPVGREQETRASAVKEIARADNIPVLTPDKLTPEALKEITALKPDLILVAAYGKILPQVLLDLPGFGALNIHYSLLPRFRGASPIQNALLFGDTETGVTLMKMDQGLDTGDIIATQKVPVASDDTALSLTPKLNEAAKELLLHALPLWVTQKIQPVTQPEDGIVLCQLIERQDGKIEWTESAHTIYNRYRAFTPWPGVFCYWKKKQDGFLRLKLLSIELHVGTLTQKYQLGEVFQIADQIAIQTGNGAVILKEVQLEGKTKMPLQDFLNGNPDFIGALLV